MPKQKTPLTAAVIDIGGNEISFKIAQCVKNKYKVIESMEYPLTLGKDTYNNGKISFEKVNKACAVIKNYLLVCKEYAADNIRIVSTSAIREAENKEYILDQIRLKTGYTVEVLDNFDEKNYIYKLLFCRMPEEIKQSAMMVHIGSGNVGLLVAQKEKVPVVQTIKVGSLRIGEIFDDIQEYSREFYLIVEEYLNSFTDAIDHLFPYSPKYFVAVGREISLIADLCGAENKQGHYVIYKNKFDELYENIKFKTVERIMDEYSLTGEKAELLLPAMCIFANLLQFSEDENIIAPNILLIDALLFEILYPADYAAVDKAFAKNTVLSAKEIAERFRCMPSHYNRVLKYSESIFDKLKKIHGLSNAERILLQTAAILHDCGKFVNIKRHYRHSYSIIKGLDIANLNSRDIEIVANLALYHSRICPLLFDRNYNSLSPEDRVIISKLCAILRIADSLERSHEQKFSKIDVKLTDEELIITVESNRNTDLELWSFNSKSKFFEEVFGIKAVFRKKAVL